MTGSNAPTATQPMGLDAGFTHDPPPAARLLGWRLEHFDPHARTLRCSFDAGEQFLNPAGVVQGGILAAMLDEAMGPLASFIQQKNVFSQTLEMKVSYLAPAAPGKIFGEARFVKMGRNIGFLEGRLMSPEGEVLAVATTTTRLLQQDRS